MAVGKDSELAGAHRMEVAGTDLEVVERRHREWAVANKGCGLVEVRRMAAVAEDRDSVVGLEGSLEAAVADSLEAEVVDSLEEGRILAVARLEDSFLHTDAVGPSLDCDEDMPSTLLQVGKSTVYDLSNRLVCVSKAEVPKKTG